MAIRSDPDTDPDTDPCRDIGKRALAEVCTVPVLLVTINIITNGGSSGDVIGNSIVKLHSWRKILCRSFHGDYSTY